jgi:signal transduction histidine kinase
MCLLWMMLTFAGPLAAQGVITRIAEVRGLAKEESAKALTVRISGVVVWRGLSAMTGFLTVMDESAGIFVNQQLALERGVWPKGLAMAALEAGMVVEIEGVTDPGGMTPVILPRSLRITGRSELPRARTTTPDWFFSGADDCQRIEVRGVVQGVRRGQDYVSLMMDGVPGEFMAVVPAGELPEVESLIDAEVRLTGVAHSRFNTRGEFLMPNVAMNSRVDLVVEKPAAVDLFTVQRVMLDGVAAFRTLPLRSHAVRVEGVVTFAAGPDLIYLQDGLNGVRVRVRRGADLRPGARVEVVGFVDDSRRIRGLKEALVRGLGREEVVEPLLVGPDEIMKVNTVSAKTSRIASPGDFDGRLIRFRARLADVPVAQSGTQRLLLEANGTRVMAALMDAGPQVLAGLERDSMLEVTGIAELLFDADAFPGSAVLPTEVHLLLRGEGDVRVVARPSWWTRARVLYALGGVLLALGAAMVWGWQLRRRVRVQALELAEHLRARRESEVEFQATLRERNRLAANLHDTLLQTVGGIGFQLDACAASAVPAGGAGGGGLTQLEVARRMVDHAAAELRSSVWALRALPLHGKSLPDGLRDIAGHVGLGHEAEIEVSTEADLPEVPEFVAGNLLLIVQEALHNALRHGRARHIGVHAGSTGDLVTVTVKDDGAGFTPGTQAGPAQGHFGLAGMKERTDRLGGHLKVESAPGQGTTVHASVPVSGGGE